MTNSRFKLSQLCEHLPNFAMCHSNLVTLPKLLTDLQVLGKVAECEGEQLCFMQYHSYRIVQLTLLREVSWWSKMVQSVYFTRTGQNF